MNNKDAERTNRPSPSDGGLSAHDDSSWLGKYLNSDLYTAERQLLDTVYAQNDAMTDLLLEVGQILGVPTAPAGVNGLFRREDFIARAREVIQNRA